MNGHKLLIMSGNAHPELARAVSHELDKEPIDAIVDHFPDGETQVKILDNVREQDVFVLQPTGPPTNHNIMEALVMIDALRRASAGRITAVLPYFGYARQDRKDDSRVPITAKLAVNLFEAAGVDRFLSIDLHAGQIQGFTDRPYDHLYAGKTIGKTLREEVDNPIFAAPDTSAGKMARGYAKRFGTEWAIVDKDRIDGATTRIAAIIGHNVVDRNVVIVDDMASTGGSLINAAEALKDQGAAKVVAAVSHGVLCGNAVPNIENSSYLDLLYTTDTLPQVGESQKIRRITIAPLLAQAILNVHKGESVSGLF